MQKKNILIIGRGFLGTYLENELKNLGHTIYSTRFSNCSSNMMMVDICNIESIMTIADRKKPDLIINCAANTNVDYLEKNPNIGYAINSEGAKNVAKVANAKGIKLIHISSDQIFDGKEGWYTETDKPNPVNIYGKTKLIAEQLIQKESKNFVIVRTNFFGFDERGVNLLNWIIKTLKEGREIIGFDDISFTPLEISNLSQLIAELCMHDYNGILHLSSNEKITKYKFALMAANVFSLNKNLIKKGKIEDLDLIATRPKNTSLSNETAKRRLHTKIIGLKESMEKIKMFYNNTV